MDIEDIDPQDKQQHNGTVLAAESNSSRLAGEKSSSIKAAAASSSGTGSSSASSTAAKRHLLAIHDMKLETIITVRAMRQIRYLHWNDNQEATAGYKEIRLFIDAPPPSSPECPWTISDASGVSQEQETRVQASEFCLKHLIAVVRQLDAALKQDLDTFSIKTLIVAKPDHIIEVPVEVHQSADENIKQSMKSKV